MSRWKLMAITVELVGIALTSIGLGIELTMHADIGYVAMTLGSTLLAIGGVIWGKFCRGGL
jgi:NADH:ubiquinone oxidoreductase subunit 6 (subunit J)